MLGLSFLLDQSVVTARSLVKFLTNLSQVRCLLSISGLPYGLICPDETTGSANNLTLISGKYKISVKFSSTGFLSLLYFSIVLKSSKLFTLRCSSISA